MTIDERAADGVVVLDINGRMTIEEVGQTSVIACVRRLLQEGHKQVLLNLEDVPHVDSTGLSQIVEAYLATRTRGGSVKLVHLNPRLEKIFAVTRLSTILETFSSEAAAIASFESADSQSTG